MITKTEAEKKLIKNIKKEKYRTIIECACETVRKIWSSEVRIVRNYTDHGYEHSQRIVEKVYEMYNVHPDILTEKEKFFLLLGIYLHDIGMQCDIKKHADIKKIAEEKYGAKFKEDYGIGTANTYTSEEQNEIRKNHHLLTGAWLEYSFRNDTILSSFLELLDSMYLQDLIDICMFHSKLDIAECNEESERSGIRTRLVAAILRFGDELDIDKERVHIETVNEFGYEKDNAIFWHLHARTKITVKESAIKLSVYLNDEDYQRVGLSINNVYVQKFKTKNKVLTDIMTQNGFSFFISEDSGVEINPFEKDIPDEIVSSLLEMDKREIKGEMIKKLESVGSSTGDETLKKVLELLLSKKEKIEFMKKYKNEFLDEASRIKLLIDELKTVCNISHEEVDQIIYKVEAMRLEQSLASIEKNEVVLEKVYKIFLFVKAFSTEQLSYLSNLGLGIRVQVYTGQAQIYVMNFFRIYLKYRDNLEMLEQDIQLEMFWDSYTFEQIERVLRSYQEIISFNPDAIIFSDYYLCQNLTAERLLAVSVSGESDKIYVWDIASKRREPVAALGGLFETVGKIKIYRYKEEIIIAACGESRIYFWNINSKQGEPIYISKAEASIIDYTVFESINGHLHVIGLVRDRIYIWKMFAGENAISSIAGGNDIFIVNTRLADVMDDYACIGRGSFCDFEEPRIILLSEKEGLNFERKAIYGIYDTIDVKERSKDGFGNRINAYALDKKGEKLFLVINTDVYVYDLKKEKLKKLIKHEGQRILDICVNEQKQKQGLLTYSIYQRCREEDMDLLNYYNIQKDDVVEHQKWTVAPEDVSQAAVSMSKGKEDIFFSHIFSNIIYRVDVASGKKEEFYTFPNTFSIKDMISE